MEYGAIVAGTGFEGRDEIIRKYIRDGMRVILEPEPENIHDSNAIAVYIMAKIGIIERKKLKIGYIKKYNAAIFSKRLKNGGRFLKVVVDSHYFELKHPRVSLRILTNW